KYINHKKMNIAATLLAENKMCSKEIAYSLGYENEMYFFRLFKSTFGMTPGKYKKECSEALDSTRNSHKSK
ncbi:MAG: helix-turn-helix transcriptional regulator, partial [Clostridia bacterium]|nr:helix-turn-helix transcriptional regulator [Clostridia bacterium]